MDALTLDHVRARYRLRPTQAGTRARLDDVLAEVLGAPLEAALDGTGPLPRGETCVRRIEVPVRLRLGAGDAELVDAWSASLAAAIRRGLVHTTGADVVHYGSRNHAIVDLVLSVAAGDLSRSWAWRSLRLWPELDEPPAAAPGRVLRALVGEPTAIVPVLVRAAAVDHRALADLLHLMGPVAVTALARAAVAAGGGVDGDVSRAAELVASPHSFEPGLRAGRRTLQRAISLAARSPLTELAAIVTVDADDESRAGLGALVALAADPAALRRDEAEMPALLAAVTLAVGESSVVSESVASSDAAPAPADQGTEREAAEQPSRRAEEPSTETTVPERPSGGTRAGGLLFLLNVLDSLSLAATLATDEALAGRSLRWTLHRLALELAPVERTDPAALAFCGLAPGSAPPDRHEPPADAGEEEALASAALAVVERLRELLNPDPEEADETLLARVVDRPAEITADPGWFEARFSLETVETELRRAGLDLDPGWLPWLGAVLRFVYD